MQGQRQVLVQQQRLKLSPQMVQSIKLMALPYADLRERIIEEIAQNPALEVISDPLEVQETPFSGDVPVPVQTPSGDFANSPLDRPGGAEREYGDVYTSEYSGGDEESDDHRDFIEGVLHREETLQEHLLEQLGELKLDTDVFTLAGLVVQNLDHDGFHIVDPSELVKGSGETMHPDTLLDTALSTVRSLEPPGCACRDFQESLVVQAKLLRPSALSGRTDELLEKTITLIEFWPTLLEKGRPDALVKALGKRHESGIVLDVDEAEGVFDILRSLDPFPGRKYDHSPGEYVVPDVLVRRTEDGFSVVINDEEIPVLGISPFFMEMEDAPAHVAAKGNSVPAEKEARDFARESVREARWFMNTLQRRNLTILKLARALVIYQSDFFRYGPARLAPLRMKDIAAEIGLHEATVSRAANGKYLQCEWGIFELRHFFSNQVGSALPGPGGTSASSLFSKEGVKETIREIIAGSGETLSDQKITELLATRGIQIARRTVAKYRGELTIKSSFER